MCTSSRDYMCRCKQTNDDLMRTSLFKEKGWLIGQPDGKSRMIIYVHMENMTAPITGGWAEIVGKMVVDLAS